MAIILRKYKVLQRAKLVLLTFFESPWHQLLLCMFDPNSVYYTRLSGLQAPENLEIFRVPSESVLLRAHTAPTEPPAAKVPPMKLPRTPIAA
jgi:hypothetical protein